MTRDGLLQIVDFNAAEKISNRFWTKRKLGVMSVALAVPTAFGLSNTDEIDRFSQMRNPGPWAVSFDGCEITSATDTTETQAKKTVEQNYEHIRSAADEQNIWHQAARVANTAVEFTKQSLEYTFVPETRFTMEHSGVEVVIYAPEQVTIDQAAFAELFHAPLLVDPDSFEHTEVRQLMDCYRKAIIEDKKFEGELFRVYVAPDGGYCLDEGRFQLEEEAETCLGHGFTPPIFDIDLAGVTIGEYRFMMLSTEHGGSETNQAISQILLHESFHAMSNLIEKEPFLLNPDEQLTKYVEGVTLAKLYPNGVPEAIVYP